MNMNDLVQVPSCCRIGLTDVVGMWGGRLIAFSVLLLAGCMTTPDRFEEAEMTPLDREEYAGKSGGRGLQVHYGVRIESRAELAVYNEDTQGHLRLREQTARDAEESVVDVFSKLGKFSILDRTNGLAVTSSSLLAERAATSVDGARQGAAPVAPADVETERSEMNVILRVDTSVIFKAKWIGNTTHPKKARGVKVTSRFKLLEPTTSEVLHGTTVVAEVECDRRDSQSAIREACRQNAGKFALLVAARLLPPGRVRETRCAGRYAHISFGKNYQVSDGFDGRTPTRVVFFEIEEGQMPGGRRRRKEVGRGTVVRASRGSAWVEGDASWLRRLLGSCSYGVRRGHLVRVRLEED